MSPVTRLARAGEPGYLEEALARAREELDAVVAARPPVRRPPVPVKVSWQLRKLGAVDAGAPVLALAAVDVDANGKADLIALTSRELLRLPTTGIMAIAVRWPLPSGPPPQRPRDPVGTLIRDRDAAGALERVVGRLHDGRRRRPAARDRSVRRLPLVHRR
jgi:hypothetical protein